MSAKLEPTVINVVETATNNKKSEICINLQDLGLGTSLSASLPERAYQATITRFEKQTQPDGKWLLVVFFTVPESNEEQRISLFPKTIEWSLRQLVDKAGLPAIHSLDELNGKTVELFYRHSYVDKKTGVQVVNKSWNLYGSVAKTEEEEDDDL